jgi:PPOX class probable F420-dependent enzyme
LLFEGKISQDYWVALYYFLTLIQKSKLARKSMFMNIIPESHRDLVSEDSKAIAYLATTLSDGAPVISPVWFGIVDEQIAVFSSSDSLKAKNMIARPHVSVVLQDPDDVYRYLQIRGQYVKSIGANAREFLDKVSRRYIGKDYPEPTSDNSVILLIQPERVNVFTWSPD